MAVAPDRVSTSVSPPLVVACKVLPSKAQLSDSPPARPLTVGAATDGLAKRKVPGSSASAPVAKVSSATPDAAAPSASAMAAWASPGSESTSVLTEPT